MKVFSLKSTEEMLKQRRKRRDLGCFLMPLKLQGADWNVNMRSSELVKSSKQNCMSWSVRDLK